MSRSQPEPVYLLRSHDMGAVKSLALLDDQYLLIGTLEGTVHTWDLETCRQTSKFTASTDSITSLHCTNDNLITQEKGGTLKNWKLTNDGFVQCNTIVTDHMGFCRAALNTETKIFAFPEANSQIGIIRTTDWENQSELVPEKDMNLGHVGCLKVFKAGDQELVIAGYESGDMLVWDINSRTLVEKCNFNIGALNCAEYDVVTNQGIIGGTEDKLVAFKMDLPNLKITAQKEIHIMNPGTNCVKFRGDKRIFATGGWDSRIRIFSSKTFKPLAVLTEHKKGGIEDIIYTKEKIKFWNACVMAAGGMDGQVSLWNLYN